MATINGPQRRDRLEVAPNAPVSSTSIRSAGMPGSATLALSSPISVAIRAPMAMATSPGTSSARRVAMRASAVSRSSDGAIPASWRMTSISAQYVMPAPYGRQRPRRMRTSPLLGDPSQDLGDQARLADPGRAKDGHDRSAAVLDDAGEDLLQPSDFAFPADQAGRWSQLPWQGQLRARPRGTR